MKQNYIQKILILLIAVWLGMTFAVDFVAVPQVFKNVPDREVAGRLGIIVFSIFNKAEVFMSVLILIIGFFAKFNSSMKKKAFILILMILSSLAFTYFSYISPIISEVVPLLHSTTDPVALEAIEVKHDFFHRLYINLDGFKIILMLIAIGFLFPQGERE